MSLSNVELPPIPNNVDAANAERRRRVALRNGVPQQAPDFNTQRDLDTLHSARVNFEVLKPLLGKFIAAIMVNPDGDASWHGYNHFYNKLQAAAALYAQLSGQPAQIPARRVRGQLETVDVQPGLRPDVVAKEVKPGPAPGPVPVGTADGIHTPGMSKMYQPAPNVDPWS